MREELPGDDGPMSTDLDATQLRWALERASYLLSRSSASIGRGLTWLAASAAATGVALLASAIVLKVVLPQKDSFDFVTMIIAGTLLMIANLPIFSFGAAQKVKADAAVVAALDVQFQALEKSGKHLEDQPITPQRER